MLTSSEYINNERKSYSLYTMQSRALPSIIDGLKASGRRVLWTARNGDKIKTASLAGATMPLHPHGDTSGAINTLAAPYGNNIPLFTGYGAFGTLLDPTAYGASRYTSVALSKFSKDVLLCDMDIIPMIHNYDDTLLEPLHFLPIVPVVLLNPTEGIAVGFATNILPRALDDIIKAQIAHLKNKKIQPIIPSFTPTSAVSHHQVVTDRGVAYYFKGTIERVSATTINITKLPYGTLHEKVLNALDDLSDQNIIVSYEDTSRDKIHITIKFKRGYLSDITDDELLQKLGLIVRHIENMNVLDFNNSSVKQATASDIITRFTDWRLGWYIKRYERLKNQVSDELQRYYDIRTAIHKNVGMVAKKTESRAELKEYLQAIGIINTDYIADMSVYRFTEQERIKNEERIKEAEHTLTQYTALLNDDQKRKEVFISELETVLSKYNKGEYNHNNSKVEKK